MITTLRESKVKLSELVQRASQGEDVLITVRGEVKARLTSAAGPGDEKAEWIKRLKTLQKKYSVPRGKTCVEDVLAETRQDRF
jgi:prevent-host-death family protein